MHSKGHLWNGDHFVQGEMSLGDGMLPDVHQAIT